MVNRVTTLDNRYTFTGDCGTDVNAGAYFMKNQSNVKNVPANYDYRKRPRGGNKRQVYTAETPYTIEVQSFLNGPLTYIRASDPVKSGTPFTCFGGWVAPSLDFSNTEKLEMLNSLARQIKGSDFNLLVSLGEGKESLQTIANGATTIYRAMSALRKGNFSAAAKHLGNPPLVKGRMSSRNAGHSLTSRWLELQYGWKPILADVYNASEYLASTLVPKVSTSFTVRRQKTASNSGPSHGYWKYGLNFRRIRRQIIARVTEPPSAVVTLGLQNPLLLSWELLPFSFVADWFYPVSTYLETRGAFQGLKATYITTDSEWNYGLGILSGSLYKVMGAEFSRQSSFYLTRSISTSVDIPLPSVTPLSEAVSWKRAVSALSLLNNFSGSSLNT